MARIISTTSTYGAPAKAATLKALQERQEQLAREREVAAKGQGPIISPWQGVAQLANTFVNARQSAQAEEQEAAGRQQLAQAMAGYGQTGTATPEQMATIGELDPDMAMRLTADMVRQRREAAALQEGRAYEEQQAAKQSATAIETEAAKDARELQQEIEREKRQAEAGKVRDLTPEEIAARPGLDPKKAYQIDPKGKIAEVGGGGQTINLPGELPGGMKKLGEKEGEKWAGYQEQAGQAGATLRDIATLEELSKIAPQGPITGALVQRFPGISNAGAAFQSVIKRVAPTLRAPGSGATSDIEYQGMLDSLPALSNRPEANAMILEVMRTKANLDIERGDIIDQIAGGDIDQKEGRAKLRELNKRSIMSPALKGLIEQESERAGKGAKQPAPAAAGGELEGLSDEELDRKIKEMGGG